MNAREHTDGYRDDGYDSEQLEAKVALALAYHVVVLLTRIVGS